MGEVKPLREGVQRPERALGKLIASAMCDEAFDSEMMFQVGVNITTVAGRLNPVCHVDQLVTLRLGAPTRRAQGHKLFKRPAGVNHSHLIFERNF